MEGEKGAAGLKAEEKREKKEKMEMEEKLIEKQKREALFCYKKFKAYQ